MINISLANVPHIRVRLAENQKIIKVSGNKMTNSLVVSGTRKKYRSDKTIIFDCQKTRSLRERNKLAIAEIKSDRSVLSWRKRNFFGDFVIVGNQYRNSCDLIQKIDMESYVSAVISKEMRSDWPIEALKAQAITARSYALNKIKNLEQESGKQIFHLENSEKHQVLGSLEDQSYLTHKAAVETSGEILVNKKGRAIPTFFHSKCGGKTMLPEDVWANSIPGYESVYCPYCHRHGKKPWKISFKKKTLKNYMKQVLTRYYPKTQFSRKRLALKNDDKGKKNISFKSLDYHYVRKADLRKKLGREKLPSSFFHIEENNRTYTIRGRGHGHGVGMCQYGAYELAKRGYNYRQILRHYFPNFKIKKAY